MKKYSQPPESLSILQEPSAAYGATNYFTLANKNISKDYIKEVLAISKLSLSEIIAILPISIDSYKRKTIFNPPVTEKVLEIEEVYRRGLDAFGTGFYAWMDTENVILGGIKPKSLLSNSFGIRKLLDQIGRMEHGVLA